MGVDVIGCEHRARTQAYLIDVKRVMKWRPQRDKVTTPLLILDDVQAERIHELARLVA